MLEIAKITHRCASCSLAGLPFNEVYCASKFAIEGACESLAVLLQHFNIQSVSNCAALSFLNYKERNWLTETLLTQCYIPQRESHWVWSSQHRLPGQPAEGRARGRIASKGGCPHAQPLWEIPAALCLSFPKCSAGHWGHCKGVFVFLQLTIAAFVIWDSIYVSITPVEKVIFKNKV